MKYFTIKELCYSETAQKKGIDNTPTEEIKAHLTELGTKILDPLREAWGSGIIVKSGYRCPKLNKAVGGSSTSAHVLGFAADLKPLNGNITRFKSFVKNWLKTSGIAFDQYINEFSGGSEWVHIGLKNGSGKQRKAFLMYKNGKYYYI